MRNISINICLEINNPGESTQDHSTMRSTKLSISQRAVINARTKITKLLMKPSETLRINSPDQTQLEELQNILPKFGVIKNIDTVNIERGYIE